MRVLTVNLHKRTMRRIGGLKWNNADIPSNDKKHPNSANTPYKNVPREEPNESTQAKCSQEKERQTWRIAISGMRMLGHDPPTCEYG